MKAGAIATAKSRIGPKANSTRGALKMKNPQNGEGLELHRHCGR